MNNKILEKLLSEEEYKIPDHWKPYIEGYEMDRGNVTIKFEPQNPITEDEKRTWHKKIMSQYHKETATDVFMEWSKR